MSEIACPACGAANSDLNPRCLRCGAPLPEESRRPKEAEAPGLADTVASPIAATVPAPPLSSGVEAHPGAKLGRFTVLEELGRGSMGMVVRAHDPALDRTVAIKVLRPEALGMLGAAEARERLLREAKAMAKVSHRNAVSVYEVDVSGDQILVVMEYIRGRNLRAWLCEQPRSLQQVLDVFRQAGRGLAEVHRTGFVHRDFKPDNVLVGADGRVCVTDFGLVGLVRDPSGAGRDRVDSQIVTETAAAASPEVTVTGTGVLMGTPAYMAPEQHQLQRADARADQFAFCVALYEALYGERPFAGKAYEEIRASVTAGALRPAPEDATVPSQLRRIVLRGLALSPGDRYPSMALLLADLEKDPQLARRRAQFVAVAVALIAITTAGVVRLTRGGAGEVLRLEAVAVGPAGDEPRGAGPAPLVAAALPAGELPLRRVVPRKRRACQHRDRMLAGFLITTLVAAPPAPASIERPTMAVVITKHEGLEFEEALELARRLARALGSAGAPEPMDPQATVTRLGGKNPEACGSRSACLADLAHALHVSALVTLDGGKVVGDIALAVALVDGRDGRKLLERTSASNPARLDEVLAPLAAELARVASALPGPSALDAPFRSTRPDLLEGPRWNLGTPTLVTGGGAVATGGVALGFLTAALVGWADLSTNTVHDPTLPSPYNYRSRYPVEEYDRRRAEVNQRLTISLVAGVGAAVLSGAATYFLLQPPAR